jgi:hypothetical protein
VDADAAAAAIARALRVAAVPPAPAPALRRVGATLARPVQGPGGQQLPALQLPRAPLRVRGLLALQRCDSFLLDPVARARNCRLGVSEQLQARTRCRAHLADASMGVGTPAVVSSMQGPASQPGSIAQVSRRPR